MSTPHHADGLAMLASAVESQTSVLELLAARLAAPPNAPGRRRSARETVALAVLELAENPSATMREIALKLGCSVSTLSRSTAFRPFWDAAQASAEREPTRGFRTAHGVVGVSHD